MYKNTLMFIGSIFLLTACQSSGAKHRYTPFVPDKIMATGVASCDSYFDQIDMCMKKQLSSSQYREFSIGITEAKQTILYMDEREVVYAEQSCKEAITEAAREYAGRCVFK